jgi:putative sterol carrier protein
MASWLSQEWAEEAAGLTSHLPPIADASGSISLTVSGGSRKEVHFHWVYKDGVAVAGAPGPQPDADLVLTLAAPDAVQVFSGAVEPSVAFMRGRLKAAGEGGLLLGFLESTRSEAFETWRRGLAGLAGETSAPPTT